jgi:hypothetical protein
MESDIWKLFKGCPTKYHLLYVRFVFLSSEIVLHICI